MSLRFRLNAIITLVVLLIAAVLAQIVIADTRRAIREEMNAGGKVTHQLMTSVLHNSRLVEDPGATDVKVLAFLRTLGRVRAHEIRYYTSSGTLVYTSPPSPYKAGRSAPAWFSNLVAPDLTPVELATPQGRVVIVPDASRAVLDAWDDLTKLLVLVTGFLVAVNVASFVLLGRFLRPLSGVLAGLAEMERGRLDVRLPRYSLPEFDAMGQAFNRMAAGLEESQAEHRRALRAELELEQNRRLTQTIQSRLEEERRALARELHDELGQSVTAIRTIGSAIAARTKDAAPEAHANAQTIVDIAGRIYDAVHSIVRELRPPALDNLGLRDALEDSVAGWRARHPDIACGLRLEGELDGLGEVVSITLYRLVQECLTNVARHAGATRVDVSVERRGGNVRLVVADDGKGLAEGGDDGHYGLIGMRERVQALDGDFELVTAPGSGLTVRATLPVRAGADAAAAASARESA
jgi:two-component system, NarL family, sensor histidine kinase UhpB